MAFRPVDTWREAHAIERLAFLSSVASSVFICVHLWLDSSLFLVHSSPPDLHPFADQSSLRLLPCGSVSSVVDRFAIFSGRVPSSDLRPSAPISGSIRRPGHPQIWCRIPVGPGAVARTARLPHSPRLCRVRGLCGPRKNLDTTLSSHG
jgi:hypothetical protein